MKLALQDGAISAFLNAHPSSFQMYAGGIYHDTACTATFDPLDWVHTVSIVGYYIDENN